MLYVFGERDGYWFFVQGVQSSKGLRGSVLCPGKSPVFAPFGPVPVLQSYRPSPLCSLPKALRFPSPSVGPLHSEIDRGKLRQKEGA